MAEEKKPKIDLKARLGKGAPTPTPAPVGAASVAVSSQPAAPPPGVSGPGLPVPPGVPIGSSIDPSNPLAAVVAPRPAMSMPVAAQAQRIEVDELAVQQAAAGARKTMGIFAFVALLIGAGVGFVGGQAKEAGDGNKQARNDARELKTSVDGAKTKIEDMATKLETGVKQLQAKEGRAFPKDLANQLGAINVDFDGSKLAGRRFAGFPAETSTQLFDFVTNVTALNEHKTAIKNLLTKLEKPITEQIQAAASGQHAIQYVVVLGGPTGKDPGSNYVATIAGLVPPVSFTGDNPTIPNDLKVSAAGQNFGVTKYKGGSIGNEPSAMYVDPRSYDAVCPAETKSAVAQLAIKIGDLITEIRGQPKNPDIIEDSKPGLLEQADTLGKGLEKVANGGK